VNLTQTTHAYNDSRFSSESASFFYLLIELSTTSAKAIWYYFPKQSVARVCEYTEIGNLDDFIANNADFKGDYAEVLISLSSPNYLLKPRAISDDSASLFALTNDFDASVEELNDFSLVNQKTDILYTVPLGLRSAIAETFSKAKLVPHIGPRVEHQLLALKSSDHQSVVEAHIHDTSVSIQMYRQDQLLLANSFFQNSIEDVAYYALFCAESFGISPSESALTLSGDVSEELVKQLSNYWPNIEPASKLGQVNIHTEMALTDKYKFDYLTKSLLCVS